MGEIKALGHTKVLKIKIIIVKIKVRTITTLTKI